MATAFELHFCDCVSTVSVMGVPLLFDRTAMYTVAVAFAPVTASEKMPPPVMVAFWHTPAAAALHASTVGEASEVEMRTRKMSAIPASAMPREITTNMAHSTPLELAEKCRYLMLAPIKKSTRR
jgi:hypothetical protein